MRGKVFYSKYMWKWDFVFLFFLDLNECLSELLVCDINVECFNIVGLFLCVCNEGYNGDGKICWGI